MSHISGNDNRDSFGSKFGVIAATAGSAVGLGNIWRFPYIAGENGGGAFLIIYLLFIILIGLPVMLSELTIGRSTQRNPFGAFRALKPGQKWFWVGVMGIAAAFMINAFYSVVAGWTLEYLVKAVTDQFSGKAPGEIVGQFNSFQATGWRPLMWTISFIVISGSVVMTGVEKGIEKFTKVLMPILVVLIVILDIRAITLPGASEGLKFLFEPDFSKITGASILEALGQAFFSLSIGMGTLITYGSYINKKENLGQATVAVAFTDTIIAILAGVAIFPAVFAFGISPASGPDLVFLTLPNIFSQMAGGYIFGLLFFFLLTVAALTSTISILEVVVAYFSEELNMSRKKATILASVGIAVLGILSSLSLHKAPGISIAGVNLFGVLEFVSSNVLLPLGGLLIVVFVAWLFGKKHLKEELTSFGLYKASYYRIYLFIIRYIAPFAIALVLMNSIGIIRF
ncbi:MAG: sodium-dependent transporter [Prolixibacteraceae bacterium]|jgi:NSS family neurotransmitter:Na+ symporter|nr:sodium-dependent transporter [Prolixibacteraceae bacterium]